jgi:hypothetical protein
VLRWFVLRWFVLRWLVLHNIPPHRYRLIDWLADGAVAIEPVCSLISLITGKLTIIVNDAFQRDWIGLCVEDITHPKVDIVNLTQAYC